MAGKENSIRTNFPVDKTTSCTCSCLSNEAKSSWYDEPTSALDPALRQQVEEVILDLRKQGMTQIVVTHDMAFAEKLQTIFDGCPVQ